MCFLWITKNHRFRRISAQNLKLFQMVMTSSYKTFCKQFSSPTQYSGYSVKLPQLPSLSNPGYFQFCLVFQQVEFSLNKTEQGAAGLRTIRTADSRYIYTHSSRYLQTHQQIYLHTHQQISTDTAVDISTHLSKWERYSTA